MLQSAKCLFNDFKYFYVVGHVILLVILGSFFCLIVLDEMCKSVPS